jgi:hypothetical protein
VARRRLKFLQDAGWIAIELPFVEGDDCDTLLLIGLDAMQAGPWAEFLEFRRSQARVAAL